MRRILHVLYSPAAEGCPRLALEMISLHDRTRFESAVAFCTPGPPDMLPDFQQQGVPIFHLGWRPKGWLSLARRTFSLCRTWKPDGIVCYTLGLHMSVALGARLAGVARIVLHIGNTPPDDNTAQRRKIGWMLQASRPLVRYEIPCSRAVADMVKKAYGLPARRLRVVYNAVPVDRIRDRADARRNSGLPSDRPVTIGMVARLEPHKDHDTLLRAFARVVRTHPGARLRLVGDGSRRGSIELLAAELGISASVDLLGSRQDVPEQLAELDVFVFSTTASEGFGIALAEALAAGTPVIATDVEACREVLDNGRYGLLTPPGEPDSLASAIVRLLDDPEERRRLSAIGHPYVKRHFDAVGMTRGYEEALFS